MWQDLRYTVRTLLKQRYFTATAVLVLALAIGLNTAMFTLINSLFLRPFAAHQPDRLRFVYLTDPDVPNFASPLRYGDYLDLLARDDLFAGVLARSGDQAQIHAQGDVFRARGEMVSENYFEVLGVPAGNGRMLAAADGDPASERVVVVSEGFWRARLAGRPDALGTPIRIDQATYTLVGIAPGWFKGTLGNWEQTQYWVPLRPRVLDFQCTGRRPTPLEDRGVTVIGRLRPGDSSASVSGALNALRLLPVARPAGAEPRDRLWTPELFEAGRANLPFAGFGRIVPEHMALALMGLASLVLLIGALNLAGMLIARGVTRRTEIATRLALGAGRWRVARQMIVESLVLSAAAGVLGLLIAQWLTATFVAAVPAQSRGVEGHGLSPAQMLSIEAPVDWRVLGFTLLVCVVAGLMTAVLPSLRAARTGVLGALSGSAGGASLQGGRRLRAWVVVPQVCLSLALLLLAGVLVRATTRVDFMDHGYDPAAIVAIAFSGPQPAWMCDRGQPSTAESEAFRKSRTAFHSRVLAAARALPGMEEAALAWSLPHAGAMASWIRGLEPREDGTLATAYISRVAATPGYFDLLRLPVVYGRTFDELENANGALVAVISERLARALWGERNPIGRHVAFGEPTSAYPPRWHEVIGVVRDVRSVEAAGEWQRPAAYVPLGQEFAGVLAVRGNGAPQATIPALKKALADADSTVIIGEGGTVADAIAAYLYPRRLAAGILGVAGLFGLLLASIGVYGVVSYSVAQRVREIGVRIALGADRADIMRMIAREGGRMAAVGIVAGVAAGFAALRIVSATVVAMPALDAVTLLAAPGLIALVVLVACYIPARRAARVDPLVALREL